MFGFGGVFAGYTYISPFLLQITGLSERSVSVMLLVFGIGAAIGNWIGGRLADRHLLLTLYGALALLALTMAVFPLLGGEPVPAAVLVLIWGMAGFALVPPLNMLVLLKAGEAADLASSLNISAFNVGNALGAALGGAAIQSGLALRGAPAAGALIGVIGLATLSAAAAADRRRRMRAAREWGASGASQRRHRQEIAGRGHKKPSSVVFIYETT